MSGLNLSKVKFTQQSDVINPRQEIYNANSSRVNTLQGDDNITGTANFSDDFGLGLYVINVNDRAFDKGKVRDNIDIYGIKNQGIINTNDGNDIVRGVAKADITATAETVSYAIAIARQKDAGAIAKAFASIKIKANADGIDNSQGAITTDKGSDRINGDAKGSISAIAWATAIAVAKAPITEGVTAFANAMAVSLAKATITATGINNNKGKIDTGEGNDKITASATASATSIANIISNSDAIKSAGVENQALAQAVADASAKATGKAIALDNHKGKIDTGDGDDIIEATAQASNKAIAIDNTKGKIDTGKGNDTIIAEAAGSYDYGIFGGTIDTGDGSDRVIASSLGDGVQINLGDGNDFFQGFGDAKIDGGKGFDIFNFGSHNIENFEISFGSKRNHNSLIFELDGITAIATNFEQFNFANGSYSYNDLMSHNIAAS